MNNQRQFKNNISRHPHLMIIPSFPMKSDCSYLCIFICCFNWASSRNVTPQILHTYGLRPVCNELCETKYDRKRNALQQKSHTNNLALCIALMWQRRFDLVLQSFGQCGHAQKPSTASGAAASVRPAAISLVALERNRNKIYVCIIQMEEGKDFSVS